MLSKSAAKTFFLGGTALCVIAFIALTVDTFGRIPAQTHADQITPAVERGHELWDSSNCMGCHTLLGEGAYYAPELTRVYTRRGPDFIRAMLRDPAAMYPGQRRMQQYDFSDQDIDDLVAFLQWIDQIDLNGFPATPVLAMRTPPVGGDASAAPDDGRPPIFNQMCVPCHSLEGRGGNVGPALDGVADRVDAEFFPRWLREPNAVRAGTRMPRLPLSDTQIDELSTWLRTLHARGGHS